jgi:hypothetical protein
MDPAIIKDEAQLRQALDFLEYLRSSEKGPERERQIELWELLIANYTKTLEPTVVADPAEGPVPIVPKVRVPKVPWIRWPILAPATGLFLLGAALVIYLRMMYHVTYFPAFFEGEEAKVLDLAQGTVVFHDYTGSWWTCFKGGFIEYNKGFTWLFVPLYMVFGYDVRVIMFVMPAITGTLVAIYLTIYRKTYPKSSLFSFFLISMFSVLCICVRRYKWHPVAYIAAISIYLYFLPYYYKGTFFLNNRLRKLVAVCLYGLSCYLYFGCFLYAVPFFILLIFFAAKSATRRDILVACGIFALAEAGFTFFYYTTDQWTIRVQEELESFADNFNAQGLQWRYWDLQQFFWTVDLSFPYLVMFGVGVYFAVRRALAGDRFALITLTLFACQWGTEFAIGGAHNPDQMNWCMIPLIGLILIGADEIIAWARRALPHGGLVVVATVLCVASLEMNHYLYINKHAPYQSFVQEWNTRTQLSLVLRTIKEDNSNAVRYYLPSPALPESEGSFDYGANLLRADYAPVFLKLTFFESEADLRRKLRLQRDNKPAVVFLSVDFHPADKKGRENDPLLGKKPEAFHPYEEIYDIAFWIRRFQFSPAEIRQFSS